jgi:hypothetical protein
LDGDLVQTPEHLGVSYLISVLRRDGHHSVLLDACPGEDGDAVVKVIALYPHFIGISLTAINLPRARALEQAMRVKLGRDVHICASGPIATFIGGQLMQIPDWDFLDPLVRGEGENVTGPLVTTVPIGAVEDLDTLPWPAQDQLEAIKARNERMPYVRVSTTRGCIAHCTFCNALHARTNLAGCKLWRARSPENVVDEIEFLMSRYDVDTFDFVDSTFEDPSGKIGKQRVQSIAELILQGRLHMYYNICALACDWREDDSELINLLYRSGPGKVLIGIEVGSDRIRKLFMKQSIVADNHRAIRSFRQHGVHVAFGFIMFNPYAEWQDIEDNVTFLLEHLGHNLRRFVTCLELYLGAEVVQQLDADHLLNSDYWQTLNPYAYGHIKPDIGRMAKMINSLFDADYLHRGSIDQEPSVFAFETFDITLHTYVSRLLRMHSDDPIARAVIAEYMDMLDAEKASLTCFNGDLFEDIMSRVKAGCDVPVDLAETVEHRYAGSMEQMKSIQLRLSMKLRPQGIQPFVVRREGSVAHA